MIVGMAPTCIKDEEDKENSLYHQVFLMDEDLKVILLTKYICYKGIVSLILSYPEIGRFFEYFLDLSGRKKVGKHLASVFRSCRDLPQRIH